MKKIIALLTLLSLFTFSNAQRVVYEIDTNLTITQGFELQKSVVLIETQYLKGMSPELAFDLKSYSDTSARIQSVESFTLKSAKSGKPVSGYGYAPLTDSQRASFCLPDYGFINVYKSIIAQELEIGEDKITVYTCYTCK